MHYFEFAEKDTTLYEASSSLNAGLDEVLEIRKDVSATGGSVDVSRILIKFDLSFISSSLESGLITNPKYYLNLFDAKPTELATSQSLYAYPVSQSWTMGDGRSYDNPVTSEGCSWTFRFGKINGQLWDSEIRESGATWFSGSGFEASHSFGHKTRDMRMDVTDIVNKWFSNNIPNNGFMVKRSGSIGNDAVNLDEGSSTLLGSFKFFSRDTHTIYTPRLEAVWNSHVWNTGSLQDLDAADLEDLQIFSTNLKPRYSTEFDGKIRIVGRPNNPTLSNSPTASAYSVIKYLPTGSQYSVIDNYTDDIIIPYGTGSYISCDSRGNFIDLNTSGLQTQREYKLLIKVISGSYAGSAGTDTEVIDNKFTFFIR